MALINEHTQGSDEDCFKIGKYAIENGSAAAVRKFKSNFPKLNESTVRDFKKNTKKSRRFHRKRVKILAL